ncbi:MAG: PilZ domain-containing protein [Archangium sp.]|nr:PilZ domain-containing protein [Archangium sp.]
MTEQRQDDREHLEATSVSVLDLESGVEFEGDGKNLSGHGLLFHAAMEPVVGADMQVTLSGRKSMKASVRVLRVEPKSGGFDVAARIK